MHYRLFAKLILLSATAFGAPQNPPADINEINALSDSSAVSLNSEIPSSVSDSSAIKFNSEIPPSAPDSSKELAFQMDEVCPHMVPGPTPKSDPKVPLRKLVCCKIISYSAKRSTQARKGRDCWWVRSFQTMCWPDSMECCEGLTTINYEGKDTIVGVNCVPIIGLPDYIPPDPNPPAVQEPALHPQSCANPNL